ncbi:MAG TPA: VOC family protein [Armatimonadota bacterium]|nr:VOC family protein [Armatimonadota bacterium]
MQLTPYLIFNGQCRSAFEFYEQLLGGKIVMMSTFGETPAADHVSPEVRDRIIHARLVVGEAVLMGSDSPPEHFEEQKGMSVSLNVEEPAEAERIFHALAEGGSVRMPIGETFWAVRFGMLTDRFGTPWMINCEKAA